MNPEMQPRQETHESQNPSSRLSLVTTHDHLHLLHLPLLPRQRIVLVFCPVQRLLGRVEVRELELEDYVQLFVGKQRVSHELLYGVRAWCLVDSDEVVY